MTDVQPTGDPELDIHRGLKAMDEVFLALPPAAEQTIEFTQLIAAYANDAGGSSIPPDVMQSWMIVSISRLELRIVELEKQVKELSKGN